MGSSRHVRDTYYLTGEGVYERGGCRRPNAGEDARAFRFSRLGPKGVSLPTDVLAAVAVAMTSEPPADADSAGVPSGYTYLGQFLDHDLTKDVTGTQLGTHVSVEALLQGRSPALDLDSLYGRGPFDLHDRAFYADDARLRMGTTAAIGLPAGDAGVAVDRPGFDLPRVGVDPTRPQTRADQRAPLIPDARNDENLAVAQTHLAFLRFHNRVVDTLAPTEPGTGLFGRARDTVVKHYQWMVRTDFLPRVVDAAIVEDVFTHGRRFFEPGVRHPDARPTMPVEFSVAAYRFGHSMVRDSYEWNRVFRTGGVTPASLLLLFAFTGVNGAFTPVTPATAATLDDPDTGTLLRLPSNWVADFRRLYDFSRTGDPALRPPGGSPNLAKRIDPRLVDPLKDLPLGAFGGRGTTPPAIQRNLAFRNLVRAQMLELASGQQMAELLGVPPLTAEELLTGADGPDLSGLTPPQRDAFLASTPLWFYVLREAELNGGRLTGMGGRIVAEVFHRAMESSRSSIVRDRAWRPSLGPVADRFDMVDLLMFAADGRAEVLNPLGDEAPPTVVPAQGGSVVLPDTAGTPVTR